MRSNFLLPQEISRALDVSLAQVGLWLSSGKLGARRAASGELEVAEISLVHLLLREGRKVPHQLHGRLKFLVIDDEPEILRSTARLLKRHAPHLDVVLAQGAATGLSTTAETLPDAVLVDMHMPQLTGVDVCGRIKEVPETADVSVIAFSGCRDHGLERELRAAGAVAVLDKPPDIAELLAVLESEIALREGSRFSTPRCSVKKMS